MRAVCHRIHSSLPEIFLNWEVRVHHEVVPLLVAGDGQAALGDGDTHRVAHFHHLFRCHVIACRNHIVFLPVGIGGLVHAEILCLFQFADVEPRHSVGHLHGVVQHFVLLVVYLVACYSIGHSVDIRRVAEQETVVTDGGVVALDGTQIIQLHRSVRTLPVIQFLQRMVFVVSYTQGIKHHLVKKEQLAVQHPHVAVEPCAHHAVGLAVLRYAVHRIYQ